MTDSDLTHDLEAVVAALDAADRVLVASHENPDGDAIGSLAACKAALTQLGKEVRLYLHQDSPIPYEYGFLDLEGLERTIEPASLDGWTLLAVDWVTSGGWGRSTPSCGRRRRRSLTSITTTTTAGSATPTWSTAAPPRPLRSWPGCSTPSGST